MKLLLLAFRSNLLHPCIHSVYSRMINVHSQNVAHGWKWKWSKVRAISFFDTFKDEIFQFFSEHQNKVSNKV
jgi:hypothetical protein